MNCDAADPDGLGTYTTGAAVLEAPALASSVTRLVAASPEPAGQLAKAPVGAGAAAQPMQLPVDRAAMERSSMGGSDAGSTVRRSQWHARYSSLT